jgi:hypothetical protein
MDFKLWRIRFQIFSLIMWGFSQIKRHKKTFFSYLLCFHSQFTECLKSTTQFLTRFLKILAVLWSNIGQIKFKNLAKIFSYNWSIFFKKVVVLFKHSVNWEWKYNNSLFSTSVYFYNELYLFDVICHTLDRNLVLYCTKYQK